MSRDIEGIGHMQQDSKVVALRLAPDDQPTRDKPAIAPSFLPRELAEDLRWVLRQLHGVDTKRSEAGESAHPGTRRFVRTWIGTAALIATGASLFIVAANERPIDWRRYLSYAGSPSSIPSSTPVERSQASPAPEGGNSREHRVALDLLRIEDATRVQRRLADLGFLFGTPNGIWGPRSRQALREFKSANGLVPHDHWNANIQARLFDLNAQRKAERRAAEPFIGTWASDAADCRAVQGAAIRISLRRAEGYGAACSFGPMRREASGWHVKAVCTGNGTAWNANINLAVSGDRLRWSSERGTTVYVRCSSG
jgi:hypothetical protein